MGLLNFEAKDVKKPESSIQLEGFLKGFSIEVMPRTAEKIRALRGHTY
jgi:methylenetetrahydrofolate reductase (NADPH)